MDDGQGESVTPKGRDRAELRGVASVDGPTIRRVNEARTCPSCGYDLRSLAVQRESTYGWLVVRCTECGTVTPMHAFKKERRVWTMGFGMLAVAWVLLKLALWGGLGGFCGGFSMSAVETSLVAFNSWGRDPTVEIGGVGSFITGAVWLLWLVPISVPFGLLFAASSPERTRLLVPMQILGVAAIVIAVWTVWAVQQLNDQFTSSFENAVMDHSAIVVAFALLAVTYAGIVVYACRPLLRLILAASAPRGVILTMAALWDSAGKPLPVRARS